MSSPSEKKAGTTLSEAWAERLGRLKSAALVSAVIGFGVQIVGTLIGHAQMTQVGMGMFLLGIPAYFVGLFLSRRWQQPPPAPAVQKGPARRPPRRKKK
jgi:hypothetical protein